MSFEGSLKTWLGTNVPLASPRIYAVSADQSVTNPYLVYQRISSPRGHTHDGPDGTVEARFQFDCCSDTLAGAQAIAEQLRAALDGFRGTLGSHQVGHAFLENEIHIYDPDSHIYQVSVDYLIGYYE